MQKKETGFDGWGCTGCDWRYSNSVKRNRPNLVLIKAAFYVHSCQSWALRKETNSMKTYLRLGPGNKDTWVANPKDATANYLEAIKLTQERLRRLGLRATLVEVPELYEMKSKFIICKGD